MIIREPFLFKEDGRGSFIFLYNSILFNYNQHR